jgi:hypothetical protein
VSVELSDLRAKITVEAHCALAAYARAHEIDKSELVRDILHKWAMKQIHGASLLANCLKAKGVASADEGTSGNALDWPDE